MSGRSYVLFEMFVFSVLLLKKWQRCVFVLFFLYMTKIDLLFVLFCIPGICIFGNGCKKHFFLHLWSNNQLLSGILRKISMMWVDDYERIIIDWPDPHSKLNEMYIFFRTTLIMPKEPLLWHFWVQNWYLSYFLFCCFAFPDNFIVESESLLLIFTC